MSRDGTPGRILVVEDDPGMRVVAVTALQRAGFAVAAAADCAQGRALARQGGVLLGVLDVMLPDGDGLDLCAELRRDLGRDFPIIFMTSQADVECRLKGFAVGGTDYITKPFSIDEFVARVRVHAGLASRMNEASVERRRLELRERTRQDMIDCLVHDIKTPLTSIMGTLSMVRDCGMIADRDIERLLVNSESAAQWMSMMINDILDLSRPGDKKLAGAPQEFAPATALEKAASFFSARCRQTGIDLGTSVEDAQERVFSDPVLLIRVLANLTSNAVRYADAGKEIVLAYARRGRLLRFEVLDRGPGIPDDKKKGVFDKYFRLQAGGAPDDGSLGIGLSFCRAAAEALGGTIWVEDRAGGGCRFILEVPEAARP